MHLPLLFSFWYPFLKTFRVANIFVTWYPPSLLIHAACHVTLNHCTMLHRLFRQKLFPYLFCFSSICSHLFLDGVQLRSLLYNCHFYGSGLFRGMSWDWLLLQKEKKKLFHIVLCSESNAEFIIEIFTDDKNHAFLFE